MSTKRFLSLLFAFVCLLVLTTDKGLTGLWNPVSDGTILGPSTFDSSLQFSELVLFQNLPNADLSERLEIRFEITKEYLVSSSTTILMRTSSEKRSGLNLLVNKNSQVELWGNLQDGYERKWTLLARSDLILPSTPTRVSLLIDQSKSLFMLNVGDRSYGMMRDSANQLLAVAKIRIEIDRVQLGSENMSSKLRMEAFSMHFASLTNTVNLDLIRYLLITVIIFVLIPFSTEFLRKSTESRVFRIWRDNLGVLGSMFFLLTLLLSQFLGQRLETRTSTVSVGTSQYSFDNVQGSTKSIEWRLDFQLNNQSVAESRPILIRGTDESHGISIWVDQYRNPFLVLGSEQIRNEAIQVVKLGDPIDKPVKFVLKAEIDQQRVSALRLTFDEKVVNVVSVRDSTPIDLSKLQIFPFNSGVQEKYAGVTTEELKIVQTSRTFWTLLVQIFGALFGLLVIPVSRTVSNRRELRARLGK